MSNLIPNSTQIPNLILDFVLPNVSQSEALCLLYICRRTFGFQKDEDRISFTQFISGIKDKSGKRLDFGTGLSRPAVSEALKNLIKSEAIFVRHSTKGNLYSINLDMDADKVVKNINQLKKLTKSGKKSEPKQVQLFNLQKKEKPRETKILQTKPSAHKSLIDYWFNLVQKTRGIKPIITGANAKNLKRVLDLDVASQSDLEKLFLYYLGNPRFKNFSPDLSICLSAGVLNTLLNIMRSDANFWKDMDNYSVQYLRKQVTQEESAKYGQMVRNLEKLKEKLSINYKSVAQPA